MGSQPDRGRGALSRTQRLSAADVCQHLTDVRQRPGAAPPHEADCSCHSCSWLCSASKVHAAVFCQQLPPLVLVSSNAAQQPHHKGYARFRQQLACNPEFTQGIATHLRRWMTAGRIAEADMLGSTGSTVCATYWYLQAAAVSVTIAPAHCARRRELLGASAPAAVCWASVCRYSSMSCSAVCMYQGMTCLWGPRERDWDRDEVDAFTALSLMDDSCPQSWYSWMRPSYWGPVLAVKLHQ